MLFFKTLSHIAQTTAFCGFNKTYILYTNVIFLLSKLGQNFCGFLSSYFLVCTQFGDVAT